MFGKIPDVLRNIKTTGNPHPKGYDRELNKTWLHLVSTGYVRKGKLTKKGNLAYKEIYR